MMSNIIPVEYQKQRILTTTQLADAYETDPIKIQQNFNNNKERYKEGKHYFLLEGEALRWFKGDLENFEVAPNVNKLYLWTEKGAWLHAKSLNTDKAWEAYERLVDEYYRVMEVVKKLPSWDKIALGEMRFAREFAKAAGIRPARAVAVALARIEKVTGETLGDYRKTLPAVNEEDAERLTPGQIGEQIGFKAHQVNRLLEDMGLQCGIREAGKSTERLIKRNPWRLTDEGKAFGILQDSASGTWEGFQVLWSAKTVDALREYLAHRGAAKE